MILKIKRFSQTEQWIIIDEIQRISISEPRIKVPNYCLADYDVVIGDVESQCNCLDSEEESSCSNCKKYIFCECIMNDNNVLRIAFDTFAYLLNNEGKTIEKIVVNN